MSLDTLPPEILNNVLGLLDRSLLKPLRQVNKTFAIRLAPLLFGELEVWLHAQSLTR